MPIHLIASTRTIDTMKPQTRRLNDGDGLHIRQTETRAKYWYQDYTFDGRRNSISLGAYPEIGLAEARRRSLEVRAQAAQGLDPSVVKRAVRLGGGYTGPLSLQSVALDWLGAMYSQWSQGYARTEESRLRTHVFPVLGQMPVVAVRPKDVTRVVRSIHESGHTETAQRVLSLVRRTFEFAVAEGYVSANPCDNVKGVVPAPTTKHHAAITDPVQLREYLLRIDRFRGTFVVQAAMLLLLLTMVRPGELAWAQWSEFDLQAGVWTIPSARMKTEPKRKLNGGPHIVMLSRQALALLLELHALTGRGKYVFVGHGKKNPVISNNTINKAIRSIGYCTYNDHSAHGSRATARTMLVEQLAWPDSVAELQLDHIVKDANGTAYNRTRFLVQRAKMLQAWADYLDQLRCGTVIPPSPDHPFGAVLNGAVSHSVLGRSTALAGDIESGSRARRVDDINTSTTV